MKLSIITINYNNAAGLQKTMESVLNQTSRDFEYIVVDGASSDSSCQVISQQLAVSSQQLTGDVEVSNIRVRWISEKDNGIYDAMNKGIRMAKGEYVQFLNSSDTLVLPDVTERMIKELQNQEIRTKNQEVIEKSEELEVQILYGNMLKRVGQKVICDKGFAGRQPTMFDFYTGTLNHSPVYIKRSLFDDFGLYDETLKYVSDWKWYVQVILYGGVNPHYVNMDVVDFDMSGVSTSNWDKTLKEKRAEMEKLFPAAILKDYDDWSFGIDQIKRLKRHPWSYKIVYLLERILFKIEKYVSNN
jgi:glycosyltransferase involved in cell wall biosynthesis